MIRLTTEQAQQIVEALQGVVNCPQEDAYWLFSIGESLATIRAARAQEQAEQPVSQEYQDHLVNQSFDWAAMAAKHQFMEGYRIGLAEMREKCAKVVESGVLGHGECAAAIRAIKFEGDTGFRPVSEMIAEQEPVSTDWTPPNYTDEQWQQLDQEYQDHVAEQKPVAYVYEKHIDGFGTRKDVAFMKRVDVGTKLYAAPVRTKDLTNSEKLYILGSHIDPITKDVMGLSLIDAVIAAYKEKNK